jgi:FkbM family methyltransferase
MQRAHPTNDVRPHVGFVERVDRAARLRLFLLRRLLRAHRHDFAKYGRIAAIVGDEIGDQIRAKGRYEDTELSVIETLILPLIPSTTDCVDVGANIGTHSLFFSKYFDRVVAFEPNPVARALFEINMRLNGIRNVELRSVGLSDTEETERISVCLDNLGASRLHPLAMATADFRDRVVEEVEVSLTPGNDALNQDRPIGLIKIDVEGMESKVLLGLDKIIKSHRPIIIVEQLASGIDARRGTSAVSIVMDKYGYRSFEIHRIKRAQVKFLNDLLTYICGTVRYNLVPITRLERKNYSALIYFPAEFVRGLPSDKGQVGAAGFAPSASSIGCSRKSSS